jgi:lipopolysaccharide export system protein LptA
MKISLQRLTAFIVLFSSILSGTYSTGLESDSRAPINIQADSAIVDDAKGLSIYRGNVNIDQGSMHITADEVEIIMGEKAVIQIIASTNSDSSKLAHYEQLTDNSEEAVYANARKITYLVQEKRLHLAGSATLKQIKDTFTGELLYYDISKGIVNLNSGGKPGDRIKMTINPKAD